MLSQKKIRIIMITVFTVFIPVIFPAHAIASHCDQWAGKVVSVQGRVDVMRNGHNAWEPLLMGDKLFRGDKIHVGSLSRAAIYLCNDATLRLDQHTTITFPAVEKEAPLRIRLLRGLGHFFSRFPRSLDVVTPYVNGSAEGTEFLISVADGQTQLTVFEGRVRLSNEAGNLAVATGSTAITQAGQAPAFITVIHPRDAVHWAIYYPAVMMVAPSDFPSPVGWHEQMRSSIDAYNHGDIMGAFDAIATLPESIQDPLFYTYRAALFLAVGRTQKAETDIRKALAIAPAHARAFALKSVMSLVQNDKGQAMMWAKKAEAAAPRSPAAQIALSYANQAYFDLEAALANIETAVGLAPENALAHARLAELWQSFGDPDKAESAAQRAIALNPNLSYTHTILGFVHLAKIKTDKAADAFETAINLDPASPMPRLGLGLTTIKDGKLDEGRRQIEIAVCLDPNNAILRSYLGKAYFDEKRNMKSGSQLSIAKSLDPNDPTPWLYDAIRKQSENRPVEALSDLRKSISLNDNRAVYRSRLLLDEDQAVRSASLARIYQDLGFGQMALNEGFKSVNTDPGNHSAHRFLADNYATLPRHEIARVSELLQAQLLQPVNITPLQPQLAETGLYVHQGTGPSAPSFNEFTNLYERDRLSAQLNAVGGGNNTWGDDVVASALWKNISFSAGQYHYETDGFRENNDQKQDIYNLFGQAAVSHDTSVQAEYRYKKVETGDLPLFFNPDNYWDNYRFEDWDQTLRGGFKHRFGIGADLVGSFIYGKSEAESTMAPYYEDLFDAEGYIAEAQHLFKREHFHLISGGGYYHTKDQLTSTYMFMPTPTILPLGSDHSYAYLYSTLKFPDNFSWTIGATADHFSNDAYNDKHLINPKLGVTWAPVSGTTVRAAVFKTFSRNPVSRQTIEPTQIAGFNQFYNDTISTEALRYGFGIDQVFSDNVFGGFEISRRELEAPYIWIDNEIKETELTETFCRFYLNLSPADWVSISLEYLFENFDEEEDPSIDEISWVTTNRFPIGINFFMPEGITLSTTATYVTQTGDFSGLGPKDEDRFWVVDAGISYRLPKRLGAISLEAKNLFNESFRFQDTDPENPFIYPERLVLGKITLAF